VLDTVKAGGITIKPSASGNITASFVPQGRAGTLPNGITNVSPYYWLLSTSRTSFNDTVKFYFDHIAGNGINNYSSLRLLRREGDGAPWIEIPTTNKSVRYIEAALSDFSEFALGGGDENPLPVELSSFLANASGTTVKLQWITQSEINTSYFAVERSILKPELQWKTIGQKQAISSGNGAHQYVYADTLLLPGNYIYRLKIVDNDGSFRYGPTAQAVIGLPRNFELQQNYPNPFNPETVICYSLPSEQHVRLKIYSLLGKEVATLKDERQPAGIYRVTFNGLGMAGGVYFYTLKTNSFSRTRKMLLLK